MATKEVHKIAWCIPLRDLITYEEENGRAYTLAKYHPLAFDLLLPLNVDIPSVIGAVDVDWMFRVAPACLNSHAGKAFYFGAKTLWNTAKGIGGLFGSGHDFNYRSVMQEGNRNAPIAANAWLRQGYTLYDLFEPARHLLEDECSKDCSVL